MPEHRPHASLDHMSLGVNDLNRSKFSTTQRSLRLGLSRTFRFRVKSPTARQVDTTPWKGLPSTSTSRTRLRSVV